VQRIGIMLSGFGKTNLSAFRYLVLKMNSVQHTFEFEFLPLNKNDNFINYVSSKSEIDRDVVKSEIPFFLDRYQNFLVNSNVDYQLQEPQPNYFLLITMGRFSDNFYTTRKYNLSILALGNWQRFMSPPSLLEFIITLILRESVSAISTSLRSSVHLGTKGCLFDFTPTLHDVKYKVLNGNICTHCRNALLEDKYPDLADELLYVLGKEWFGTSSDPMSPANITLKLGYDLFTTKGLEATPWEKFLHIITEEGMRQIITIVGGIIFAVLIVWFGLK
jgi:hypothetical protein